MTTESGASQPDQVQGEVPSDEEWPAGPKDWEADVVLRDGSVAHVRPIRPSDADPIREFHSKQSEESIYLRFFAPIKQLSDKDVFRFTHVDHHDRVALVVTVGDEIIGIGRFDRIDPTSAEVAFNISDHYHGKGIGSVLLEHLAAIAPDVGITRFTAEVLPQNRKMLGVFRDAGYEVAHRLEDGVIAVGFDILPTEKSRAVAMQREHRAESVSMRGILFPKTVAIIGASRREDSVGGQLVRNLAAGDFQGSLYAVHPEVDEVAGLPAVRSIADVPGPVDLAVVCVRADKVLQVTEECGHAEVRNLLIVSSGFAETGREEDIALQAELRRMAREWGMRVVGPNSFGLMNNHPDVRLNATLAPELPPRGRLGLFAQSGALGIAVLARAARRNLGISEFASAGNRVDVSGNDLMQFWMDDDDTAVVGLYLESMGNPRKFSRIARQLALIKPVIVISSGVSSFGTPPGHQTRQVQVPRRAFGALLRQAGVIRVENLHQLFDIAQLAVHQALPAGERVAVVGNSDALGALAAGAADGWGLKVSHGPVSLTPEASPEEFAEALDAAFADPEVDSVIASFTPPLITEDEQVQAAVREVVAKYEKPCVATFLGMRGIEGGLSYEAPDGAPRVVPTYPLPEDAIRALAAVTRYAQWRERDRGELVTAPNATPQAAHDMIERILEEEPEGRALTREESTELLAAYGIRLWPARNVASVEEAVEAADAIGYPVILKSTSPAVRHQPGITGIVPDLVDAQDVRDAYAALTGRLGVLAEDSFVVQRMAIPGVSCRLRKDEDPLFGPVISFSLAGPSTDLLGDIAHRVPPLTDVDVDDLMTSIKGAPLLFGHKGSTPVHKSALADLIARVSVLGDEQPDIALLELNPVNAWSGGLDVLGADIVVRPAQVRKDAGRRAMT